MADALATTAGAVLGTSTTTTFVESSAGVAAGGRTGLTALTSALLFLGSTLFAPIFTAIPSFATTPALIIVGFLMFCNVTKIKLDGMDYTELIPAYLCVLVMPLAYSISEGIIFGVLSYVILNLACGKKERLNPVLCVLAVLFVCKYIFL
jgi:AGZA family xanthine/uracil permease-like MFS transporter